MNIIDDNRTTQVSTHERIKEIEKQLELLKFAMTKPAEEIAEMKKLYWLYQSHHISLIRCSMR